MPVWGILCAYLGRIMPVRGELWLSEENYSCLGELCLSGENYARLGRIMPVWGELCLSGEDDVCKE